MPILFQSPWLPMPPRDHDAIVSSRDGTYDLCPMCEEFPGLRQTRDLHNLSAGMGYTFTYLKYSCLCGDLQPSFVIAHTGFTEAELRGVVENA